MVQRVAIRIDVGADIPLDLIAQLVQSTSTVCNTALSLDRQSELNRATRLLPLDEPSRIELIEYLQTRRYRLYGDDPDDKPYRYSGRIRDILERLFLSSATFGPPNLRPPAEAPAGEPAVPGIGPGAAGVFAAGDAAGPSGETGPMVGSSTALAEQFAGVVTAGHRVAARQPTPTTVAARDPGGRCRSACSWGRQGSEPGMATSAAEWRHRIGRSR
jgi:hypothetical protein